MSTSIFTFHQQAEYDMWKLAHVNDEALEGVTITPPDSYPAQIKLTKLNGKVTEVSNWRYIRHDDLEFFSPY